MNKLGSGDNGEFTFLDILSITSFVIAIMNLDANLGQNDKAELQEDLSNKTNYLLDEIHTHLNTQDKKLDLILKEIRHEKD